MSYCITWPACCRISFMKLFIKGHLKTFSSHSWVLSLIVATAGHVNVHDHLNTRVCVCVITQFHIDWERGWDEVMLQIHHPAINDLHIDAGRRRGVRVRACVRVGRGCMCLFVVCGNWYFQTTSLCIFNACVQCNYTNDLSSHFPAAVIRWEQPNTLNGV